MIPAISTSNDFTKFAKHKRAGVKTNNRDAIIYTRVSSAEQMENNSLEIQQRECMQFAQRKGLTVVGTFGGTYESAQTDERKEFTQMIAFAKRNRVSTIIVYTLDRFSRSGDNAIWLTRKLRNSGIHLDSVAAPVDTHNPTGVFMQNMLLLFAQHDNDQRRMKTIDGMQERLRKGEWCTKAPAGYKNVADGSEKKVVPDEKFAPLIKKAFEWKAQQSITDVEIIERLIAAGWPKKQMNSKRLSEIFRNPFYCGYIVSSLIEGEVVKAKHKPIVSRELFLQVNAKKSKNHHGYTHNKVNDNLPLKSFVRCQYCGTGYAGYIVKKKGLYYYKCNQKGCKCNRRAELMHDHFKGVLSELQIDEKLVAPLKTALLEKVEELTAESRELTPAYKRNITELEKKLDTLNERFALGEIPKEMHMKFETKFKGEIAELLEQIEKAGINLSNPEMYVEKNLELALKAALLWESSDYSGKTKLQDFIFPDGIRYDHKNGQYRTSRINGVFAFIALNTGVYAKEKTGLIIEDNEKSGFVAGTGLEPVTFGL